VHCNNIAIYIQQDAMLYSLFFWKLLYMFQVVPSPIIRSAYDCIYSIWYLSHRYCYLPLSWKSWNRFECTVRHPQHTQTGSNSSTIAADSSNGLTNTSVCTPDDGWKYYPKHVEQFPVINKLCNVASCWIYIAIQCCCLSLSSALPCMFPCGVSTYYPSTRVYTVLRQKIGV
jgi:hypothetical protein